jgi:hypothetical protein
MDNQLTRGRFFAAATATALVAMAALAGCADFESPADPTSGLPDVLVADPDFATDILPMFTKRCSIGGCHSFATAQAELDLSANVAYDNIVGVASRQRPQYSRIRPFRPDSSWLVLLISAGPGGVDGYARMPLSSIPLTANQIGTIVNWVNAGAVR